MTAGRLYHLSISSKGLGSQVLENSLGPISQTFTDQTLIAGLVDLTLNVYSGRFTFSIADDTRTNIGHSLTINNFTL